MDMLQYFKFHDFGEMHDVMEAVWRWEDDSAIRRTMFAVYSSGDNHQLYCSRTENLAQSQERVRLCALAHDAAYEIVSRDPEAFDGVFARLAGIAPIERKDTRP